MHTILNILSMYGNVAMMGLILIQMIMIFVMIRMVKRLKRHVETIQEKVQDYLSVVMEGEEEEEETPKHVVSIQERQMLESLAKKQRNQQEEIFNAVLQEIFP